LIILDTNVVSELMKKKPCDAVAAWARRHRPGEFVTTSITAMELHAGVQKLNPGKRQRELGDGVAWVLSELLQNRILNFDERAAREAAVWHAQLRRSGRTMQVTDSQIAGIAMSRRIPIATRDVGDFSGIAVKLIDPWAWSGS
jgi:toxin FitB